MFALKMQFSIDFIGQNYDVESTTNFAIKSWLLYVLDCIHIELSFTSISEAHQEYKKFQLKL